MRTRGKSEQIYKGTRSTRGSRTSTGIATLALLAVGLAAVGPVVFGPAVVKTSKPVVLPRNALVSYRTQQNYDSVVTALNPLAFWPLQVSSGSVSSGTTAPDIAGGHSGSYYGTTVTSIAGPFGGYAPEFSTGDDVASFANNTALNPATSNLTLSAWFNDTSDTSATTLSFGDESLLFMATGGNDLARAGIEGTNGGALRSASFVVPATTWHLETVTFSPSVADIYVDGQLAFSQTNFEGPLVWGSSTNQIVNGGSNLGVADVAEFPYTLSARQVATLCQYSCGLEPPQGGAFDTTSYRGGGSPSIHCPCAQAGAAHPVNTATGDLYETVTDLRVPGPGLPLDFTRTYDQENATAGFGEGLGRGWSYNLGMSLSISGGGTTATVTEENGAQDEFTQYINSSASPPWCPSTDTSSDFCPNAPNILATVHMVSSTQYTMTRDVDSSRIFTFTGSGTSFPLTEVQDGTVSGSYDYLQSTSYGSCPTGDTCTQWQSFTPGAILVGTLTIIFSSSGVTVIGQGAESGATPMTSTYCLYGQTCASAESGNGSPSNDLFSVTNPGNLSTYYVYDPTNHLVDETSPPTTSGYSTSLTMLKNTFDSSSGNVTQQTDPAGQVTTFCYIGDNWTAIGGSTKVVTYPGAATGTACSPSGNYDQTVYNYQYSELQSTVRGESTDPVQPTTWTGRDPVTGIATATVDANGNLETQTLQGFAAGSSAFGVANVLTSTDALGNTTDYAYTSLNLPWCSVSAAEVAQGVQCPTAESDFNTPPGPGPTSATSSCTSISTVACLGATFTYYDTSGTRPIAVTDPLGNTSATTYNSAGQVTCTVTAEEYTVGDINCPTMALTSAPTGEMTGYTTDIYNSNGQEKSTTTPDGATTSYAYGDTNFPALPTSVTDPQGDVTTNTYGDSQTSSSYGKLTKSVVKYKAYTATTVNAYDSSGRLYCTIAPEQYAQGFTVCPSPQTSPPSTTDPFPGTSITIFDADSRPTYQINSMGGVTQTSYDSAGEVFCTVTPRNHASGTICPSSPPTTPPPPTPPPGYTTNIYDDLGQQTSTTDAIGDTTVTTYDAAGNVTSTEYEAASPTNEPYRTTDYQYDADNRRVAECQDSEDGAALDAAGSCGQSNVTAMSCPTSSACIAVDNAGNALTGNTSTWSGTKKIDTAGLSALSCWSASGCVATDNAGDFLTYNGSWSLPSSADSSASIDSVSCTSSSFCMAVDQSGDVLSYNGTSWTTPSSIDSSGVTAVSCIGSSPTCVAVDGAGGWLTYSGSWGSATSFDGTNNVTGVSCTSTTFCAAVDSFGNTLTYNGSAWTSAATDPGNAFAAVSCTGTSTPTCIAGDNVGNESEFNGTWSTPAVLDGTTAVVSVACASSSVCFAAKTSGDIASVSGSTVAVAWADHPPTTSLDTTTLSSFDPDGNVYCSVSAHAYVLGPYNPTAGAGTYQCPPWQASWVAAPPSPSPTASSVLYSYTPSAAQADGVTLSFYDADGNLVQQTVPGLTQAQNTSGASPDTSTTVTAYEPGGGAYCSIDSANLTTYLGTHGTAPWPYQCPSPPPTSAPTGTTDDTQTLTNEDGQVQSSTDPLGETTTTSYDKYGDTSGTTNPAGAVTSNCYGIQNAVGQCAESSLGGSWDTATSLGSSGTVDAVSCPTAGFCAAVDSLGNGFTYKSVHPSGSGWSSATVLDSTKKLYSLSCSSATFCLTGAANGNVYQLTSSGWSTTPSLVDADSGKIIESVNCAPAISSGTLCAAGDSGGNVYTYSTATGWSGLTNLTSGVVNVVSCPTTTFCAAVSSVGTVFTYSASTSTWSIGTTLDSGVSFKALSCASATLCVAADADGNAYVYNGTSWTTTAQVLDASKVVEVASCALGSSFCMVGDAIGNVFTYGTGGWSSGTNLGFTSAINSISCPTAASCEIVDSGDHAFSYNGNGYSSAQFLANAADSVSCPTTLFCVAGTATETGALFHGSLWQPTGSIESGRALQAVSCATISFCNVVDNGGYDYDYNTSAVTSNDVDFSTILSATSCPTIAFCADGDTAGNVILGTGLSGSSPTWTSTTVDSGFEIDSISCVSSTLCFAGTDDGKVWKYNGTTWTASTLHSGTAITSVSCIASGATADCAAGDQSGKAYTYAGTSWTTGTTLGSGLSTYVACRSTTACVAVNTDGRAYTSSSGTWSSYTQVTHATTIQLDSVSCASSAYCVAVDEDGNAYDFNGTAWTGPANVSDGNAIDVSCVPALCLAVDENSDGKVYVLAGSVAANQEFSTTQPPSSANPAGSTTVTTEYPGGAAAMTLTDSGATLDSYDQNGDVDASNYVNSTPGFTQSPNASYSYNPDGTRSKMVDGTGTTSYQYDDVGDMIQEALAATATGLNNQTMIYTYYSQGVLGTVTYPYVSDPPRKATYTYNALGQMASVTGWNSDEVVFTYGADGNETGQNNEVSSGSPSGSSSTTWSYDLADRNVGATTTAGVITAGLTPTGGTGSTDTVANILGPNSPPVVLGAGSGCTGSTGTTVTQGFGPANGGSRDPDGQLTSDEIEVAGTCSSTDTASLAFDYNYDAAGRVVYEGNAAATETTPCAAPTETFCYDAAGDPTTMSTTGTPGSFDTFTQATDAAGEILSQTPTGTGGASSYTYDTIGDRISDSNNGTTTNYGYDQLGRMTSKSTSPTQTFDYSGDGLEIAKISGSTTTQLVWNTSGSLPLLESNGIFDFIYGPGDTPVEQFDITSSPPTSNPTFLNFTQADSTYVETDQAGQVTNIFGFDAYGSLLDGQSPGSPFEFAGQYAAITSDIMTEFDMRARWYDTRTGEFTTVDPLVAQTDQPYEYAGDDPVNESDPSGLAVFDPCGSTKEQGSDVALCDVKQLLAMEYGPLPDSTFATVEGSVTTGFIAGAACLFGGPLVIGCAIAGAGFGTNQELKNDYSYVNYQYIEASVEAAINVIYSDMNGQFINFGGGQYASCFSGNANVCNAIPAIEGTTAWNFFYGALTSSLFLKIWFAGDAQSAVANIFRSIATSAYRVPVAPNSPC